MGWWPEKRISYDASDNVEYTGRNATIGAATSDADWKIFRFYYDGNDNIVRIQGPVTGAWNDRATLGW